jgi:hypothetical protein
LAAPAFAADAAASSPLSRKASSAGCNASISVRSPKSAPP